MMTPDPRRNALERIDNPAVPPAAPARDPNFFRVHGRVPAALLAQHAISPQDAVPFTPDKADLRAFGRLRRAGVVIEAAPGCFFLDLVRYHEDAEARRKRNWPIALGFAIIVAALALLFYRSGALAPQPLSRP